MQFFDVLPARNLAATLPCRAREASEEGFMLQQSAAAANFGVHTKLVISDAATLGRGPGAAGADAIYAYKGRPRPPEPPKAPAPAPAPKDGQAPAPKPTETPKDGKKDAK
jgi:hypothetical protein